MLQQTQVARVMQKYPEFLRTFPTLRHLSRAERRDVIIAWRGMGYNNRAVRLHRLARTVIESHGGELPASEEALVALPGIGKYTARAILSSVHRRSVAVLDVNVRRFYSRFFFHMETESAVCSEPVAWRIADRLIPPRRGYDWNQALMDMGATVCTARNPRCDVCPVAVHCCSRAGMTGAPPRSRREPGLHGTPNRIYRGRIVELLRSGRKHTAWQRDEIGRQIVPGYGTRNQRWLEKVLRSLETDGLIVLEYSRRGVLSTATLA